MLTFFPSLSADGSMQQNQSNGSDDDPLEIQQCQRGKFFLIVKLMLFNCL